MRADGEFVGLLPGQIGNSEVGHITIGAGRPIPMSLPTINESIKDDSLKDHPVIRRFVNALKKTGGVAHLAGLFSSGGGHAHQDHMIYLANALANESINVNVTLIFSVSQAILATKAGARYLSPFVGRVDDQRFGGCNLINRIREVLHPSWAEYYEYDAEILSASIRSVGDVEHSFAQGADIVTMPPAIFAKMYNHVLTDVGIEIFDKDYANAISNK